MNEHTMTLIDSVRQYLVAEEKNKKIYHLPLEIAIRFDLARVREQYPQTTLNIEPDMPHSVLSLE